MGACASSHSEHYADFQGTPFSVRLRPDELELFSSLFILRKFDKSVEIFVENTPDSGDFFLICHGEVDICIQEQLLCTKIKGDSLRISSVDEPTTRTASAITRTYTTCLQLSMLKLKEFFKAFPNTKEVLSPLLMDPTDSLTQIAFCKTIPSDKLTILAHMLRHVALRKNEMLFEEGSLGSALYMVHSGSLRAVALIDALTHTPLSPQHNKTALLSPSAHSRSSSLTPSTPAGGGGTTSSAVIEKTLHSFSAGDVFGEISLIMDIPRTASILAESDSLCFELQRDSFQKFVKLVPQHLELSNIVKARVAEHFRKYRVPFFEAIPDHKYASLAALCKIEQIPPQQVIFKEGDKGNAFYIIAHGECRVTVTKKDGGDTHRRQSVSKSSSKLHPPQGLPSMSPPSVSAQHTPSVSDSPQEIELCRMGPGKYFGEIALVQDTPRTATVTTLSRCVILSISRENFQKFFEEAPEAIADFEVKLARYDVQLRSVIYHPIGLEYFTQYLKREHSEENIEFWKSVRDFRHLSYADIKKTPEEEKKDEEALMAEEAQQDNLTAPISTTTTARMRRQSLERAREADLKVAFDLVAVVAGRKVLSEVELHHLCDILAFRVEDTLVRAMFDELSDNADFVNKDMFIRRLLECDPTYPKLPALGLVPASPPVTASTRLSLGSSRQHSHTVSHRMSTASQQQYDASTKEAKEFLRRLLLKLSRLIFDNHLSKVRIAFDICDTNKNGSIDGEEFANVLKALGGENNPEKIAAIFYNAITQSTLAFSGDLMSPLPPTPNTSAVASSGFSSALVPSDSSGELTMNFEQFVRYWIRERQNKEKLKALLTERANYIFDTYIADSAPRQVNIKGPTQQEIADVMKSGKISHGIFNKAEEEILKLLSADSFSRFKQHELFQTFLSNSNSYTHVAEGGRKKMVDDKNAKVRSGSMNITPLIRNMSLDEVIVKVSAQNNRNAKKSSNKIEEDEKKAAIEE